MSLNSSTSILHATSQNEQLTKELAEIENILYESQKIQQEFSTIKDLITPIQEQQSKLNSELNNHREVLQEIGRQANSLSSQIIKEKTQRVQLSPRQHQLDQLKAESYLKLSLLTNQFDQIHENKALEQQSLNVNDSIKDQTQQFMKQLGLIYEEYWQVSNNLDSQIEAEKVNRKNMHDKVSELQNQMMDLCSIGGESTKKELQEARREFEELVQKKEALLEEDRQITQMLGAGSFASNDEM